MEKEIDFNRNIMNIINLIFKHILYVDILV